MTSVLVLHPIPAFRGGIAEALDAERFDYVPFEGVDWHEWLAQDGRRCVLVHISGPSSWKRIAEASNTEDVITVAVFSGLTEFSVLLALRAGVFGLADESWRPELIASVIESAVEQWMCMPVAVAHGLGAARLDAEITEEQVRILTACRADLGINAIANQVVFMSTRSVRRRISDACQRLGANDVAEAYGILRRNGLLE